MNLVFGIVFAVLVFLIASVLIVRTLPTDTTKAGGGLSDDDRAGPDAEV